MQTYCGDVKYENLLEMGLMMIDDLKEAVETDAFATDPHSLGSILGVIDLIPAAEMTIFASLARKASSIYLQFKRGEYPEQDPPDWHKFVTIRLAGEKVVNGDLPINYGTPYEENYKAHCGR
jgi:succinate dehydrogenase/fumarate reductase flavoprotein subunit